MSRSRGASIGLRLAVIAMPLAKVLTWETSMSALRRSAQTLRAPSTRTDPLARDDALDDALMAMIAICMAGMVTSSAALWLDDRLSTPVTHWVAASALTSCFAAAALSIFWMLRAQWFDGSPRRAPGLVDDLVALVVGGVSAYLVL